MEYRWVIVIYELEGLGFKSLGFRVWGVGFQGLGSRLLVSPFIMENQMEKTMENKLEAGII